MTPEETDNRGWVAALHPDDGRAVEGRWLEGLQTGEFIAARNRIRAVDGSYRNFLARAKPTRNAAGKIVRWTGSLTDVEDLIQAQEALRRSESRFRLLSETAGALLASPSPQRVVEELCTKVMEHLDCQVFFNFLVDESRGRLCLNAYAGIPEEEARRIEWLDYGVAVCGCAARDGQRIVAEHIFETPDPRTELVNGYGVQAYACHPLMSGSRLLGTLSFGTKTRSAFSVEDLRLMETVTDQVATAMEKTQLLETIQVGRDELEIRVQERTIALEKANRDLADRSERLN
jgi:transcriptional regulator with GAF, ATPase, and Fis domain